jgi:hypothetical protein
MVRGRPARLRGGRAPAGSFVVRVQSVGDGGADGREPSSIATTNPSNVFSDENRAARPVERCSTRPQNRRRGPPSVPKWTTKAWSTDGLDPAWKPCPLEGISPVE